MEWRFLMPFCSSEEMKKEEKKQKNMEWRFLCPFVPGKKKERNEKE